MKTYCVAEWNKNDRLLNTIEIWLVNLEKLFRCLFNIIAVQIAGRLYVRVCAHARARVSIHWGKKNHLDIVTSHCLTYDLADDADI